MALSATVEAVASPTNVTQRRFTLLDVSTVRAYQRGAEKLHGWNTTSVFRIEKADS
jgi:hypothetical protein